MKQRNGSVTWKIEQWKPLKMNRKKNFKNEDSLRNLSDNIKHNIHMIGVPEREEREKAAENISENITAENVSNLGKVLDIQVQETQRVPKRMQLKRTIPRHVAIKMAKMKNKERIKICEGKAGTSYAGQH